MINRVTSLILSIIILLSALCACGDSNAEKPTEPTTEPATSATETQAETAPSVSEADLKKVNDIFEEAFADNGFKGAVYLVYNGEELYSGGAGKANKQENTLNNADVVYHIASVTKQFTAAAILKLCEEKKLSLTDTLSSFFPEYNAGADITIHNLLSMQSGIPDFARAYDENGYETEVTSDFMIDGVEEENSAAENREAIKKFIFSQELLFDQGERFSYCNSNYFLLGEIIEQVSGTSYFDYVRTNFFEPCGMSTAGFMDSYDVEGATVAKGYHNIGFASELFNYSGVAFACGDIMASPKDMYKWSIALHSGKVLSDEMYRLMTTEHAKGSPGYSSYGYGLMINNGAYFHNGSLPCFLSFVMYMPRNDIYLAVMSNYASETFMTVAQDSLLKISQETNILPSLL